VGKCVLFESKWVSPTEFENMSGIHSAKKWRKSIKYKGEPIGDWLAKTQQDHINNPFLDSQKSQEPANLQCGQLVRTPGNENNDPLLFSESLLTDFQDFKTQSSTDDLSKLVRTMDEKIGRMSNQIETLTQEMKDQDTRYKNATKELRQTIQELNAKISQLEDQLQNQVAPGSQPASTLTPTLSPKTYAQVATVPARDENEFSTLKSQLQQVTLSLQNQQKLLEMKERENRANNLVITGIQESSSEAENTMDVVTTFLSNKLGLTDITIAKTRRLGKKQAQRTRPIVLTLDSSTTKKKILAKRVALAGSKIYINPDLTNEQRQAEKRLRDLKKQLLQHPDYQNKKVSIYRGKLHVDRIPISSPELQAAAVME